MMILGIAMTMNIFKKMRCAVCDVLCFGRSNYIYDNSAVSVPNIEPIGLYWLMGLLHNIGKSILLVLLLFLLI